MYRLALLSLFVGLVFAYPPHRRVWLAVACVSAAELAAWGIYGHNDPELYIIQSTAALLGGMALCSVGTKLAFYHAAVLALTLCAYLALSLDVAAGMHVLIYNYYEAVVYGLVAGQLIGIFPTVRACLILWHTVRPTSLGHFQGSKKI